MNYRHAFHAGNFADLLKHAMLTRMLRDLTLNPAALTVIDTHAGSGLYDLWGDAARRTGEGEAGIVRLMADPRAPAVFGDLKASVTRLNTGGEVRYYPGSPMLIVHALRTRDRYIACELQPDEHSALKQVLPREAGVRVHKGDGWTHAMLAAPVAPAPLLMLIDPPFEQGDDYAAALALLGQVVSVNAGAVVAIWLPIKDLATYDAFLGEVEDTSGAPVLTAEVRLRPLSNPMRLNGCAMIVANPPGSLEATAALAADWIAGAVGEAGALGRVQVFQPT